ncbi:hypothetical protein RO3G_03942 [Rhizopus delemar RA 99-880]|uniref:Uncharacterized protein n=1 Tax=Rhizopus delemar (strain RA 99-880 / ATCC MYA-4621 / FGSC 9543 / NRRL 43880) TaxID=246409 RepID=I1BSQ7_RHIO9|nr:hypothetical protein RO3G_03942 [Rhizopus delemar RA 99-880]|eukprot:EIE79237.1 hypothetical protein RO3G_03942 [Rhizopus delemar RA 99-880]
MISAPSVASNLRNDPMLNKIFSTDCIDKDYDTRLSYFGNGRASFSKNIVPHNEYSKEFMVGN